MAGKDVALKIAAHLEDRRDGDTLPDLEAYAFSPGGALLGRSPLKDGAGAVGVPARKEPQSVRVVIGPRLDLADDRLLAELVRLDAAEHHLRVTADGAELTLAVPRPSWWCWILSRCTVRGTLLKSTTSGGVALELPVCHAQVEVYEVDPLVLIWPRLPRDILDRLREIVAIVPKFPPHPDPGPLRELLEAALRVNGVRPGPTPAPSPYVTRAELAEVAQERFGAHEAGGAQAEARMDADVRTLPIREIVPEAILPRDVDAEHARLASAVATLSADSVVAAAAAQGDSAFRHAILARPVLLRPILCLLFPRFVTTRLLTTTTTDECGHFHATFWRGCTSDQPDLYFVAYATFWGFRIPIYRPTPISCHTYWDYVCGTEVTLHSTSPFAQTCAPCRPVVAGANWVLVSRIGNLPLSRIHGTGALLPGGPADLGLTDGGAPFGGLLRLALEFDNALRDDLGVQYYRVSYKRAGSGNPWTPLEGEVHRHFAHVVGGQLVLEAYNLGPKVVGSTSALFEIPPALPPLGQWSIPDAVEDTTSAKFPTGDTNPASGGFVPPGAEGLYKLRVELFDTAGQPVSLSGTGIHFVVPESTDLSGTITTVEAASLGLVPGAPVGTGNAFVMQVHVDNNPTAASIAAPLLNGSVAADAHCGILHYHPGDDVTLAYTASHPHGFADYTFTLVRGVTTLTPPSAHAAVSPGPTSTTITEAVLRDGCPVAGFAEQLDVTGTATDGWSRQGYDAHALRAFVLSPH
jgi:hypothetical protein